MNPKQFLVVGGAILVLVGLLGFFGVIGPTAEQSIFGSAWWFDQGENWAHLVIGVVGLIAAYTFPASTQKPLVMLLGVIGVLIGLYSLIFSSSFLGANLENPADSLLHLVVGVWALYASWGKSSVGGMSPMGGQM
ncbi:MAG: DUF4383 domain-containing protein [Candidatus Doudnabacteria bacterium]|nr:DUF4383 domain-containing protein [Candidatus Doudnabacteria bacterium]